MSKRAIAFTISALLSVPAAAQEGTVYSPSGAAVAPNVALGTVKPANIFQRAQFSSGGVGLRNRPSGVLGVSGVSKPTKGAYVYWAVLTQGPAPAATKNVSVKRIAPTTSAAVNVTGTVIGTGPSPCWTNTNTITVFKGDVPLSVANGGGSYQITLQRGAFGNTAYGDPWFGSPKPPLMEGASMVIVGTGRATVSLYDAGLAGATFSGPLTYTLALPVATTGNVTLDNIGADGQKGVSRAASTSLAQDITTINGVNVAGPGSPVNDSDWNGNIAAPLPQLWDNTGQQINAAAPTGTTALKVAISAPGDCLTPVANVVAEFPG